MQHLRNGHNERECNGEKRQGADPVLGLKDGEMNERSEGEERVG